MLLILILAASVQADVQLYNYTSSKIVTIDNGIAKVQNGIFRFIHKFDIDKYEYCLQDIRHFTKSFETSRNPIIPILKEELNRTFELLESIRVSKIAKTKRSINILGTAWKYLAGSPDHDDLEKIINNLEKLNANNNEQFVINDSFETRLNNITRITNLLVNNIKKSSILSNELIMINQNKLRLIKEEILNIKYAIQWSKLGMINSFLLNELEIKLTIEKIKNENIPFTSPEEALEFTNIKVMHNSTLMLYVIEIPLTSNIVYKKMLIKPIKNNNVIVKLKFNEILSIEKQFYGIKSKCKKFSNLEICNTNNLIDLSNDSCLPKILNSLPSSCYTMNGHHIPAIEEISTGTLLLNEFSGTLNVNEEPRNITGSFIISYTNTTIRIGDSIYRNIDANPTKIIPLVDQPTPTEIEQLQFLSLESLHELHINNTKRISEFSKSTEIRELSLALIILTTLIPLIILIIFRKNKQKTIFVNEIPKPPRVENSIPINLRETQAISSYSNFRLNDLPFLYSIEDNRI